jgi:predicted nucleic acid-binding protein
MGAKKPIRVVIDTNVIVSTLLCGGVPARLLALWRDATILPLAL